MQGRFANRPYDLPFLAYSSGSFGQEFRKCRALFLCKSI